MITAKDVRDAARSGVYEDRAGRRFSGCPVSALPTTLREKGWRNVSRLSDRHTLVNMGLEVTEARYIGGVSPKQFVQVVVATTPTPAQWPQNERHRNPTHWAWDVARWIHNSLGVRDLILEQVSAAAECERRADALGNETWRWNGRWHRACALALVDYI